jgi:GNAT superfamily N-acetyltransferase
MGATSSEFRDVILRHGGTLRLRPPVAADGDAVLAFLTGLSEQSVYRRFHGFPALHRETIEPFLDPDWDDRGALVGTLNDEVVALANYVRLRDPASAEVAFAVADALQGQGVGTRLSSSWPRRPPPRASPCSSPRSCPGTGRCWASSPMPALPSRAASTAARPRSACRSLRPGPIAML